MRFCISAVATATAVAVLAGCAPKQTYDSVLWRQIRDQQTVVHEALHTVAGSPIREALILRLGEVAILWEPSGKPPSFSQSVPTSIIYGLHDAGEDEFGDPTVEFTEFVSSGVRPNVPREDVTTPGTGEYTGPSVVYTCYTWRVVFVADLVWDAQMINYASEADLECDARLVAELPEDAAHISTAELTG